MKPRISVLSGIAVVMTAVSALAQAGPRTEGFGDFSFSSSKDPIQVRSDRLEFDYKANKAVFLGSVEAIQRDIHLLSDELTVVYSQSAERQEVEEVIAAGSVRIEQGDRRANCRRATFRQATRTLTLDGDAVLEDGTNRVSGKTITVYPDESRFVITSGEERKVRVLLFPEKAPTLPSNGSPEDETGPDVGP